MSKGSKSFFQRWIINILAVLVAAYAVRGINYDDPFSLVLASLVLGILNAFLRPILLFLSLPFLIVTLGLFTLVVNALLLYIVGSLVPGFHVAGFWPAFKGALVISIISMIANSLTGNKTEVKVKSATKPPDSEGPVIDV
jgi:putative membrane protein